ncbi:tryptophan 7-halogenase [Alteromonas sp. ASW11-36]|uniref:Tryptophan 7-halogenase n=1 Tax=Alteromonas arenosi TaxID=3055817 RepID=A0ABT7SW49_9ALTE|nr:tryptophan halogenase family protein [Alteromonas sp. ASW11-36]MDM7860390.1 tryptophan 7-halogenase [Alteromonas sp. ASW11-36]
MNSEISNIVIVGGGTAGWLTAAVLAAHFDTQSNFTIRLIESPNIKTIGVGEGTWPTMAATLRRIGLSEAQFISECDASFKQGSRFINWHRGEGESYYHPFSLPIGYNDINIVDHWLESGAQQPFDEFATTQAAVCNQHLAPKQAKTPEYANVVNYGYHLNAGKFANLLREHCVNNLGVEHISADVTAVDAPNGEIIQSVTLDDGAQISGDLFIDCTGFKRLLIGQSLGVQFNSIKDVLFNDRAMAFQVPYADDNAPINSTTHATAHKNGWIWDIALPTRRGIGIVYSSKYGDEQQAYDTVEAYIQEHMPHANFADLTPNKITLDPGHLETFWKGNCVAIGLSAGFIDPLEATAMILIEFGAKFLKDHLPARQSDLDVLANKFNQRMNLHWRNIIDFIKLHYVLSERDDSDYWRDHRHASTIPEPLQRSLAMWQYRAPWHADVEVAESMFPPASYQFILYGMGFKTQCTLNNRRLAERERVHLANLQKNKHTELQKLCQHLPTNRQLLHDIKRSWNNRL